MKELERENAKLKQLYAETALENKALKDLLDRKLLTPPEKREAIALNLE